MKTLTIPIIRHTYLLYTELHTLTPSIPKLARHTLWQKALTSTLELLQGLLAIANTPLISRAAKLNEQSNKLELLRILIRLSFDTKILSRKKYLALQSSLDEIGRMIGGWLKSIAKGNSYQ